MKIYKVRVTKRNHNFADAHYVTEDALEQYKAVMEARYHLPLLFDVRETNLQPGKNSRVYAFTKKGFTTRFGVK